MLGKNASVVDMWREFLPGELYQQCGLTGVSGGVLQVEVEPGPYMHELRVIKDELLEHLRGRFSGVKDIKFCPRKGLGG